MSIFPKKITTGDNVVIHVRLENLSRVCLPVKINLYVENRHASYKEWIVKDDFLTLPPFSEEEKVKFLDRYFIFNMSSKKPLGRYNSILYIDYLEERKESLTKQTDFFDVEMVSARRDKGSIFLRNKANIETSVKVCFVNNSFTKTLPPFGTFSFSQEEFLYIVYANNNVIIC